MNLRFYIDPETGRPHIYNHGVTEHEAREILVGRGIDERGRDDSRVKYGQTMAGRYLKVIYREPKESELFIITAYELTRRMRKALRRRLRGR